MVREDGPCLISDGPGVKSNRRLDASRIGVGERFLVEWTLGVCGEERLREEVFREESCAGERSLLDIRFEVISRVDMCLDGLRAEASRCGSGATAWLVAAPMLTTRVQAQRHCNERDEKRQERKRLCGVHPRALGPLRKKKRNIIVRNPTTGHANRLSGATTSQARRDGRIAFPAWQHKHLGRHSDTAKALYVHELITGGFRCTWGATQPEDLLVTPSG